MKEKIEKRLAAAHDKVRKQETKVAEHQAGIRALAAQTPDMILSAMPTKLQNMQEAMSYLEMLQHEVMVPDRKGAFRPLHLIKVPGLTPSLAYHENSIGAYIQSSSCRTFLPWETYALNVSSYTDSILEHALLKAGEYVCALTQQAFADILYIVIPENDDQHSLSIWIWT